MQPHLFNIIGPMQVARQTYLGIYLKTTLLRANLLHPLNTLCPITLAMGM